ncbi:MAG: GtrA family protein [Oscillospiraceae bacterium]
MKELIKKYMRVIKFGAVGFVNTLVDFLMFTLSSELMSFSPAAAQSVGYGSGILCSFVLNHFFTFSDAKKESAAGEAMRFIRFVVVNGVSWVVSATLMYYFTEWGMQRYFAKVIITGITMVMNYFGYKVLVFGIKGG